MSSREITETSKSALLELGLSLKTYREDVDPIRWMGTVLTYRKIF